MRRSALFVSIFALASGAASAQAVGTYNGTSADGNTITFNVVADPNSGKLMINSAGISYTAVCPKGVPNLNSGLGFDPQTTIVSKKATYKSALPSNAYEAFNLTFDTSNNTVTGNVTSVSSQLKKKTGTPTKSYVCTSATQTLTASLATSNVEGH